MWCFELFNNIFLMRVVFRSVSCHRFEELAFAGPVVLICSFVSVQCSDAFKDIYLTITL